MVRLVILQLVNVLAVIALPVKLVTLQLVNVLVVTVAISALTVRLWIRRVVALSKQVVAVTGRCLFLILILVTPSVARAVRALMVLSLMRMGIVAQVVRKALLKTLAGTA
jgi:hypothetical protein